MSAYVKSVRGIPVYRNENAGKSIVTIKQSVKALEENDCLLIFVDVEYTDIEEKSCGEIYKGFSAVDKLYYKRNKTHIPFVPVYANNSETVIHKPVYFSETVNTGDVFDEIVRGIYNP